MKFDVSDKILILGYSGSGKTTLLEYFVNYYFVNFPHIVIIDSVYRFSKLRDRFYFGITQCNNPKPNKICVHVRNKGEFERVVFTLNRYPYPVFLIVDEIDQYIDPYSLPFEFGLYSEQGRNWNQGGIFTARRLGSVHKSIFSNAHYLILFKIINKMDLQYLKSVLDFDVDELNNEIGEHEFYLIDLHLSRLEGKYVLQNNEIHKL